MLQPKIYVKDKNKVYDTQVIDYKNKIVIFFDNETQCTYTRLFSEVEFIYNTGYKDMNGNYIYTGDILEYQGEATKYYIKKLLVKKDGEQEFYYLTNTGILLSRLMNMDDYKVIGNIYENKELLGCK